LNALLGEMGTAESVETAPVGTLPVASQTGTGKPFVTLLVIVQEKRAKQGEWVSISVFEPLVHDLPDGMVKGEKIYAEGRLRLRHWEDKDGKPRTGMQLTASTFLALDRIGRRARRRRPASEKVAPAQRDHARPQQQGEIAA
jgi:single-stranded DNA-binding protein